MSEEVKSSSGQLRAGRPVPPQPVSKEGGGILPFIGALGGFLAVLVTVWQTVAASLPTEATMAFTFFCVVVFLKVLLDSVLIVKTGDAVLIERLGTYHRTATSGLHLVLPIVENCKRLSWSYLAERENGQGNYMKRLSTYRVPMRESTFDFPAIEATTRDRIRGEVNGVLTYEIVDAYKAAYAVDNLWGAMGLLVGASVRNAVCDLDFEDAKFKRDEIVSKICADFVERSARWGIRLVEVDIQSITASSGIARSTEDLVRATREARAKVEKQKALREVALIQNETKNELHLAEAKAKATAEAESIRIAAAAKREARMQEVEMEAHRLRALLEVVKDPEILVRLKQVELLATSPGDRMLVVPYNSQLGGQALTATALSLGQQLAAADNRGQSTAQRGNGSPSANVLAMD